VQAIVQLTLKRPLKLGVVKIARMKFEIIGMHRNRGVPEVYENFHALAFGASGEIQEWMFVELELRKDAFEPGVGCVAHTVILTGVAVCALECRSL